MTYLYTPAEIAAALRLLADDFAAGPNLRLPALAVRVDVQVCAWDNVPEADRIAAVDLLAGAALSADAERRRMAGGGWHYAVPYDHREHSSGLHVAVYTGDVSAPVEAVAA